MIPSVLIGIILAVCVVSSLLFYVFVRSKQQSKKSFPSSSSINSENQRLKYSIRPSIDIVTKQIRNEFPMRTSRSSEQHLSTTVTHHTENEINPNQRKRSITPTPYTMRSTSLAHGVLTPRRPQSANWRQGSIVDSNQMALIEFTVPSTTNKYRRRSVAVCNNIIEPKQGLTISSLTNNSTQTTPPPRLLTFHLMHLTSSQLKIHFDSLTPLSPSINLQQLNIKIKLLPDGKEKCLHLKKPINNERIFDSNEEYSVTFANISAEKLNEKTLLMTIDGKEQHRKTIHFGQIGKIHLNEIKYLEEGKQIDFIHEIEKIKKSSIEVLIALQQNNDRYMSVDIQRLKGLKVDQKHLDATCYLRAVLLDRHRPLSTRQTKCFRINSTTLNINEQFDFSLLGFNTNTFDRLMVIVSLHTNTNDPIEHRCVARIQLASTLLCSGSGTIHWQQFKARQSFSMWHTLIKQ